MRHLPNAHFLTGNPLVEMLPDGVNVIVRSNIGFEDSRGRRWWVIAPKRSDGASIPELLWPWLGGPYNGFHRDGALLHDDAAYIFAPPAECSYWQALWSKERAAADRMIWEATICRINTCLATGELSWIRGQLAYQKADVIYDGLRAGGWKAWADHARENAKSKIGVAE